MDKIREQIEWNIDKYSPEMATEEILNLFIVNGIDFAKWLQDNYSTNDKQGSNKPLPKGYWRKDFTDDVYKIGTIAKIVRSFKMPDGNTTIIIQGKKRFRVKEWTAEEPYLKAQVASRLESRPRSCR